MITIWRGFHICVSLCLCKLANVVTAETAHRLLPIQGVTNPWQFYHDVTEITGAGQAREGQVLILGGRAEDTHERCGGRCRTGATT